MRVLFRSTNTVVAGGNIISHHNQLPSDSTTGYERLLAIDSADPLLGPRFCTSVVRDGVRSTDNERHMSLSHLDGRETR